MLTGLVTLGFAIGSVIVWSARQEGRINAHDQLFTEREKQELERSNDIKARLTRIELKLDTLNGKSH